MSIEEESLKRGARRRRVPRSFRDLTPTEAFHPTVFFYEMVWKAFFTKRTGEYKVPAFPQLKRDQLALTWIGHASFLLQFGGVNLLIDPNFANWLFWQKRIRRAGLRIQDLPQIDVVLLTHAHFDHFHKPSLRRLPAPRIAIVPWGVGDLARGLGFSRIIELDWWESFSRDDWKVTFTPAKHWGARVLHDEHRGFGGFLIEHAGRRVFHAGDSAYFRGFKEIGRRSPPEIAILPIGTYYPDAFRKVHMGPDEAIKVFLDLKAQWLVPMHFGSFKLSFEAMDEPPRRLREIGSRRGIRERIRILEEGVTEIF